MSHSFNTLAEAVRAFPHFGKRDALRYFDGFRVHRISYERLYRFALQCARLFEELKVERGDCVMLWAPNSPAWATLCCSCALRGVVLVPLDARNEPDLARRIAQETQVKAVFRTRFKPDPGIEAPTILTEELLSRIEDLAPVEDNATIDPADVMQILYTSGATGAPKGVVLTQGNQATNLSDILERVDVDESFHLLSVLPLSHALEQIGGFWIPLASGGSILHLGVVKPSILTQAFQRERVTAMVVVPRLLEMLKQRIEEQLEAKRLSGYLRLGQAIAPYLPHVFRKAFFLPVHRRFNLGFHLFVCGGASLPLQVERFWKNLGFRILKGYGLTETSPVLTVESYKRSRFGSVGHPLRSVELTLSNEGEIRAKGPNVFSGYFNNPEATQASFEDGWFKTGDVGEIDADGFLFIRSRKKDVIVTQDGVNIYPEDIEPALNEAPGVKEACVLGMGEDESEVHAALILESDEIDPKTCVDHANRRLSPELRIVEYHIWPEAEFPKTTTLKIRKNEIRKRLADSADRNTAPIEEMGTPLQRILSELSGVPVQEITLEDALGDRLGLSSIQRMELIARLENEFRLDIAENQLTAETTVGDLERLTSDRSQNIPALPLRRWTLSTPIHTLRVAFEETVMRALLALFVKPRVLGLENVAGLQGPLLIASNHTSHIDTPLIKQLFPAPIGRHICPAAWKEYFDCHNAPLHVRIGKWLAWQYATLLVNIFPLPQDMTARRSMAYAGELVDQGWSVLIYPEGTRTKDGQLQPFRDGVGFLAERLRIPIIPVAIKGGEKVLPGGAAWPKRGEVEVSIGKPIDPKGMSMQEIASKLRQEIEVMYVSL